MTREEAAQLIAALIEPKPLTAEQRADPTEMARRKQFGCESRECAATLTSELEYERLVRTFIEAFEKGNLTRLWPTAHEALDKALEKIARDGTVDEPQFVRLLADHDDCKLDEALEGDEIVRDGARAGSSQSSSKPSRSAGKRLFKKRLEPTTATTELAARDENPEPTQSCGRAAFFVNGREIFESLSLLILSFFFSSSSREKRRNLPGGG